LEACIYKAKHLTDEREKLTIEFQKENQELNEKIKNLEAQLTSQSKQKLDRSLSGTSDC
jgi:sugar-specific transcriptional regulator TrmB